VTLTQPAGTRTRTENGVEKGVLCSPAFVTFGPRLPEDPDGFDELPGSGQYFFEPVFVLADHTEYRLPGGTIDITPQVNEAIGRILSHHDDNDNDIAHGDNLFEIVIDHEVTLPVVSGEDGGGTRISVDPWDDDEEVIVWVGFDD
jgi:hypothetical protein